MTEINKLRRGETIKLCMANDERWCQVLLANENDEAILQEDYNGNEYYIRKSDGVVDVFRQKGKKTGYIGKAVIKT